MKGRYILILVKTVVIVINKIIFLFILESFGRDRRTDLKLTGCQQKRRRSRPNGSRIKRNIISLITITTS